MAFYTHLPPGPYRFTAIGCNNDGVWNEQGAAFDFYLEHISIKPGPSIGACLLAVALAGTSFYGLRMSKMKARQRN